MVLVAPGPLCHIGGSGNAGLTGSRTAERGSGRAVLAQLRGDVGVRPHFDPGLAGGLRAWLEDAAFEATDGRPDGAPLLLGPRSLLGSNVEIEEDRVVGPPSVARLVHRLVHVLFRQIVHTGACDDPLGDAVAALVALGDQPVVEDVAALDEGDRGILADALALHARHLVDLVPRFAPTWLPRTDDYVAVPLAGGRVVLHGVFDLLVGLPRPGTASLCALGLATGDGARQRRSLHFLALLETLRSGIPPFRVALLESATGRYGVEDVREEHLQAMAAHISAWLVRGGGPPDG